VLWVGCEPAPLRSQQPKASGFAGGWLLSVSGRPAEGERLAEQSVKVLEKLYQPTDRILRRPLQILAAARLEVGKTARAREAVKRIRSIRINGPEDNALVRGIAGTLLQIEGRKSEAEAEYLAAFRAWEEAGRSDSADAAGILCISARFTWKNSGWMKLVECYVCGFATQPHLTTAFRRLVGITPKAYRG
jgi:hypothetical protein